MVVTYSPPSHYLNQWCPIVNQTLRNIFQWNIIWNTKVFIKENAFEDTVCEIGSTLSWPKCVNTLRPRQNGRHFADDICKCIFLNENVRIPIEISLKFVPKGPINNIPSLVQIMAWRRPGDKPLSEPMIVTLLTHICVTRPQWVKTGSEDMHNQYPDYWCLETKQWWQLNYMNNFFFKIFLHINDLWNWWSVAMGRWIYSTLYNGCNYLSMLVLQLIYASKQDTGLVIATAAELHAHAFSDTDNFTYTFTDEMTLSNMANKI